MYFADKSFFSTFAPKPIRMNTPFFDVNLIMALLGGKVSVALNHKLAQNFKKYEIHLSTDEWLVLLILREKDGITQTLLGTTTYKDKAWVNRTINKMELNHLLLRKKGKEDNRERRIFLTLEGRSLAENAFQVANRTLMESLKGLTTTEIKICQDVLRKVFENAAD